MHLPGAEAAWVFEPRLVAVAAAATGLYLRGWWMVRRPGGALASPWRPLAFAGGLSVLYVAVASPLDARAAVSLRDHMAQHLLLLVVAPVLLLAGAPLVPFARGVPPALRRALARAVRRVPIRGAWSGCALPAAGWLAWSVALWAWHVPTLYELALRDRAWHELEHATFLAAGLAFWWPVVAPWPSRGPRAGWTLVPYLIGADVQNTALAALYVFADRPLYPSYAAAPGALDDQVAAGLLMWIPMSFAFLVPAAMMTLRLLSPSRPAGGAAAHRDFARQGG